MTLTPWNTNVGVDCRGGVENVSEKVRKDSDEDSGERKGENPSKKRKKGERWQCLSNIPVPLQ
jgi:hypothetical protein